MKPELYYRAWQRTTCVVNYVLGQGFPHDDPKRGAAAKVYADIAGDFGIPTARDIGDFRAALVNLAVQDAPGIITPTDARRANACEAARWALDVYELATA